eukprot:TRINITY_DN8584_c0_g1_i1.p1 TRINITY_DN8584_c0_g1~~TRINITY_DN8584_c0_g1_i1.p1  ORF type:complete len:298 (+),score=37.49 TRINITY_DN8584_c0_g1_i1:14-907(+)
MSATQMDTTSSYGWVRGELDEPYFLMPLSLRQMLGVTREEANQTWFYAYGTILSFFMWSFMYQLSHYFSSALFSTYHTLTREKKAEWNSRIVSNINASLMTFEMLCIAPLHTDIRITITTPTLETPPLLVSFLMCRFTGYMLYDLVLMICYRNSFGDAPSIFHHSLAIVAAVFYRWLSKGIWYFYCLSLMEGTTPFVNQHWFFTISGMKASPQYKINGVIMFLGFFLLRVCLPTALFIQFFVQAWPQRAELPELLIAVTPFWILLIGGLNAFWFVKITRGMLRSLHGQAPAKPIKAE